MNARAADRPRGLRAVCAVLVLAATWTGLPFGATSSAVQVRHRASPVIVQVRSLNPSVPTASSTHEPLTIGLRLINTTGKALRNVQVLATRADPLDSQRSLDASLANTTPTASGRPVTPIRPVTVDIPANGTTTTSFVTTTSVLDDGRGICLCAGAGVYPVTFSAHASTSAGADLQLGITATYLPSFYTKPAPVQVSWVWPLIDRPHRLSNENVFTDDDLAQSVAGGRLDRALQVVEAVKARNPRIPLTLVLDPELLDELEVMATGKYTVRPGTGAAVAGTGKQAATDWLARFHTVLQDNTTIHIDLVPYGDPDIESLGQARLDWTAILPPTMSANVATALAGHTPELIAWPATGVMSAATLHAALSSGVSTALLDSAAVRPSVDAAGSPVSVGTLRSGSGSLVASVSSTALSNDVQGSVAPGTAGTAQLPKLIAELAIRAAADPTSRHVAVLVAPRYVDPSVDTAARAIVDTSVSIFTQPAALTKAVTLASAATTTSTRIALPRPSATAAALPAAIIDHLRRARIVVAALSTLLVTTTSSQFLLEQLPQAIQRLESSAWRYRSTVQGGGAATGVELSNRFSDQLESLMTGVHILRPSSGSYTLASSNSPLPITVENTLDFAVSIRVAVTTLNGLPGFSARDVGPQRIQPHSKVPLRIPTTVERSGRIPVEAQLSAPDGTALGKPVPLFVHSTVLGVVGVVITVVAGAVLALALLIRVVRRLRARRRRGRDGGGLPPQGRGRRAVATTGSAP